MNLEEHAQSLRDMIESARTVKGEAFVNVVTALVDVNHLVLALRVTVTAEQWASLHPIVLLKCSNLLSEIKRANNIEGAELDEALAFADRVLEHSRVRV